MFKLALVTISMH